MTRSIRLALIAAGVAAAPFVASAGAAEPKAPASPEDIVRYYEGPDREYDADLKAAGDRALKSLKAQLAKKPKRPAIVFDIDDTLMSTYRCAKADDFERSAITLCQARYDQDRIRPVWKLLKYAQKRKVAIVVITGRPVGIEPGTRQQLKRNGLRGRYTLVMRRNDQYGQPTIPFKSGARKAVQKRGYKILVNIGDQKSDLSGGASVKRFKVPNPMYFTP